MHDIVAIGILHDRDLVGLEQKCRYIHKAIIAHASRFGCDLQSPSCNPLVPSSHEPHPHHTLSTCKLALSSAIPIWPKAEHLVVPMAIWPATLRPEGVHLRSGERAKGKKQPRKAGPLFFPFPTFLIRGHGFPASSPAVVNKLLHHMKNNAPSSNLAFPCHLTHVLSLVGSKSSFCSSRHF